MSDESMVRNLAAQAEAIWPQEQHVFRAHALPAAPRILDVGCGTGEIVIRLAELFPAATITGVDVVESHLAHARERCAHLGDRVELRVADAFELPFATGTFDLVVCRHVLQAVPEPQRVIAELVRVAKSGGIVHLVVEDYDMIHASRPEVAWFWHTAPRMYGPATGCDFYIGRNAYQHLRALPVTDIRYDYVVVDTVRVARETFAAIFTAWRDGYAETLVQYLPKSLAEIRAYFDATIDCIRDPDAYVAWMVPVVSARVAR